MTIDKFLHPNHPARVIISGPGECGKSVHLTNLFLNIISDYNKKYTSTHPVVIKIYFRI